MPDTGGPVGFRPAGPLFPTACEQESAAGPIFRPMSDDANLHAEERARDLIDAQLRAAGWEVASLDQMNPFAPGVARREAVLRRGHGRVDYLLYVDRSVVGGDRGQAGGAFAHRRGVPVDELCRRADRSAVGAGGTRRGAVAVHLRGQWCRDPHSPLFWTTRSPLGGTAVARRLHR